MNMRMYARYVDDSNQIIESDETDQEKVAQKLITIANSVLDGIEMEGDLTCRHVDNSIAILDMKVWLDKKGIAYYKHYEKAVASKLLIPARSAHAASCKRSVHICEIVRRCL